MERNIIWRTYGATDITFATIILILISVVLILSVPRRYVIPVLLFPVTFISLTQRVVIAGIDFDIIRILIIITWTRIFIKGEARNIKLNALDIIYILFIFFGSLNYTLLRMESSALIYRLGWAFSGLGLYFIFRFMIKEYDDLFLIIKSMVFVVIVMGVFVTIERLTTRNYLSVFGGAEIPAFRDGRYRCQGAFGHAILAGTFGASLFPFFFALWWQDSKYKLYAVLGMISSVLITLNSASSGPIFTLFTAIFALMMWPLHPYMRKIRWGILIILIGLELVMKAHVWFIINRVAFIGASKAYHRAIIIDNAVHRLGEWWLFGIESTAHWGYGLQDMTNQFVRHGVDGGLITFILFILVIVFCFKYTGLLLQSYQQMPFSVKIIFWALGSSIFAHMVSYFGVSYWDQIIFWWILLLGIISSLRNIRDRLLENEDLVEQDNIYLNGQIT